MSIELILVISLIGIVAIMGCNTVVMVTVAGRPDDVKSVRLACKNN